MVNRFFISDTHFGHENTCTKFKRDDGTPLRPFENAEEMDETMVERWNSVVKPNDHVYHLGDVVINKKNLPIMNRLNGKKKLIMGNHDIFGVDEYKKYFYEIAAYRVFVDDFVCSHVPLHPDCISDRFKVNVHGHLHANRITRPYVEPGIVINHHRQVVDPRYFSVCVEQIDYTPISFEDLKKRIKDQM
jgi:calcineurin-like phosphoesterase family protein